MDRKLALVNNEHELQPLTRQYKRVDRASADPAIALERIPTDDNTDELTQNTVRKMCALIRDSATDPIVQRCAAYAKKHFSCGSDDPAALSWGVFWYVKHCVKFRSDEGTMMQIGEHALDLLTAPAVLVRMRNPSEDCDGFTMLSAAMLTILGVPVYVTTVATDLDDPRRWSHVFLCAVVNGRVMPLDTSHGKAPGWMVPRDRINRFQTWTLDGQPADVKIPTYQGLHGYRGYGRGLGAPRLPIVLLKKRRGMGQDSTDTTDTGTWVETDIVEPVQGLFSTAGTDLSNFFNDVTAGSSGTTDVVATTTGASAAPYFASLGIDSTTAAAAAPLVQAPAGYTGPTIVSGSSATPAAPSGYQWAQIINASGNNLAKILTVAQGGTAITLPNGNQLLYGAGANVNTSSLLTSLSGSTGLSPTVLMIGGIGLLALLLLKK